MKRHGEIQLKLDAIPLPDSQKACITNMQAQGYITLSWFIEPDSSSYETISK